MKSRILPLAWVVVGVVFLSAATVYGQGGGGGGGRDRRREGYDPAEMLKRMDENNNGKLEPNEVSGGSRSFVERAAERAKLDTKEAMPIDRLLPAMQAISEEYRTQQGGGRTPGSPASSSTPSGSSPSSTRPGIGGGAPARPVGGFGAPAAGAPATSGFGAPSSRAGSIMSLEAKYDQSVIDYVNGTLLREQDKNSDGHIDKAEWTAAGTWSKSNPPENSDLNKDGKLSRDELCIRISKSRGIPIKGETASSSPAGGSYSGSSPAGGSSGSGDQIRAYAGGLLRQFDKNRDGMLQRDEWKEMKTEHQGADSNGDNTITLDELSTRISAYSSGGAGSSPLTPGSAPPSFGSRNRGNFDKTAAAATGKKSYRFLTPTERLPKGMDDKFLKSDADGDGQIMMHEFSSNWTEAIAADFAKYDADSDGIITPNEWLAVSPKR